MRLLTASVRKGYSYMKTSKQSEGGEAPKISKMSNAGESMSMASEVASEPESELDGDGRPRSAPMTSAQNVSPVKPYFLFFPKKYARSPSIFRQNWECI